MAHSASTADIRSWARDNAMPVGERGRLAPELIQAFEKAHTSLPAPLDKPTSRPSKRTTAAAPVRVVRAKEHWDWERRESR